jgi:hypothetical protein
MSPFGRFRPTPLQARLFISLLILTPLGFLTKSYVGPAAPWVRDSLGGVLYEMFWCWIVVLFCPKFNPWKTALAVFLVTSVLEVAQLWHPPFLEVIRRTFLGAALLGTTFAWLDFPHYLLGCLIAAGWIRMMSKKKNGFYITVCLGPICNPNPERENKTPDRFGR